MRNDGNGTDSYSIVGVQPPKSWPVRYFTGTKNITADVKSGSYSTGNLKVSGNRTYRVVVTIPRSAHAGDVKTWFVHAVSYRAQSEQGLNRRDVVGIRAKAK